MHTTDQLDRLKVKDVFNDYTARPFLYVYPDTKLIEVVTFLAIGPEIYVDGMVVVTEENHNGKRVQIPIGRIGGKNVLCSMLERIFDQQEDFFRDRTASEIMVELTESDCVQLESPLSKVISIFWRTRFAFIPIISTTKEYNTDKPIIIGTLSIRDFLPLIVNKKIHISSSGEKEVSISQISSPVESVNEDSTIKDTVTIMVKKGIRNIGIRSCDQNHEKKFNEKGKVKDMDSKLLYIVNDRKIMEFLLGHRKREEFNPIFSPINKLDIIRTHATRGDITIIEAAQHLMEMKNQFLILEGNEHIITPWDLIMKTVGKGDSPYIQ
jgi:CBS domain-containing protein